MSVTASIASHATATGTARAIASGEARAVDVAKAALDRARATQPTLNCFTSILEDRALAEAARVDAARAAGHPLPPLAGVPYAAKDLFDMLGEVTLAGSAINRDDPPAKEDAFLVGRMRAAGAVLVGGLNMDEYAFGFTTENSHYGATRNPHDPARIAGGSSGGSAASVAAGIVPLSLGTDTNGSVRVPASLCGVYGLKPTFGRLSRRGTVPLAPSFDHAGLFASGVADLALFYDCAQGLDGRDPAQARREPEPCSAAVGAGIEGLRLGVLGGHFEQNADEQALANRDAVARALGTSRRACLPESGRARAAATLMLTAEAAAYHLADLRTRPMDFDPMTRDRLLAGTRIPGTWTVQSARFRAWFLARAMQEFERFDVLLAPATPWAATHVGSPTHMLHGREVVVARELGVLTSPLSFIGLPVLAVPVFGGAGLPLGVQLIAAPWNERLLFRVAAHLERAGICGCRPAPPVASPPVGPT